MSSVPPADEDGCAPCKPCGRSRRTNDFGRCTVCGEAIARPGPRRASLLGALVWNHGPLLLLLAATAAIVTVAVHVSRAMPSGAALSEVGDRMVQEYPWLKPVGLGAVVAAVAALERVARRR